MGTPQTDLIAAHPLLVAPDIGRAVAFYRDLLGFCVRGLHGDPPAYGIVERGNVRIHFMPGAAQPNHLSNPHASDIYLHIANVDALADKFQSHNLRIVRGPETYQDGMREVVVEDGDGYYLCFAQEVDTNTVAPR